MNDRVENLLLNYNRCLVFFGYVSQRMETFGDKKEILDHTRWMIEHMLSEEWAEKSEAKTNRWLGFIQGVLVAHKIFSIKDLRDHSRPLYNPEIPEWELEM